MTIARRLPARAVYKCDICGIEDIWQKSWSSYGSIVIAEEYPDDMITVCSEKCRGELDRRLVAGEIQLPIVSIRGYYVRKTKERVGY